MTTDVVFGLPAWVDTVLNRVAATLVAANACAADLVFVYEGEADALLVRPPADLFLGVAVARLAVDQGPVRGGGAGQTVFAGEVRVDAFRRVGGDQEFRAARLLTQAGGLAALVKQVVDALQLQPLAAADGNGQLGTPLVEPLRLLSCDFAPRAPASGWAVCRTLWAARFRYAVGS